MYLSFHSMNQSKGCMHKLKKYVFFYVWMMCVLLWNNTLWSKTPPHTIEQPVHVIVLTSLSCPHCLKIADETKAMIDTLTAKGRITAEWGDFPNDLATLIATKLTYAFGPEKRYELYRYFLKHQNEWHTIGWRETLEGMARDLGIPQKEIDDAFKEGSPIEEEIIERLNKLLKNPHFKIDYVPVLIVHTDKESYLLDVDEKALEKVLEKIQKDKDKLRAKNEKENAYFDILPNTVEGHRPLQGMA